MDHDGFGSEQHAQGERACRARLAPTGRGQAGKSPAIQSRPAGRPPIAGGGVLRIKRNVLRPEWRRSKAPASTAGTERVIVDEGEDGRRTDFAGPIWRWTCRGRAVGRVEEAALHGDRPAILRALGVGDSLEHRIIGDLRREPLEHKGACGPRSLRPSSGYRGRGSALCERSDSRWCRAPASPYGEHRSHVEPAARMRRAQQ